MGAVTVDDLKGWQLFSYLSPRDLAQLATTHLVLTVACIMANHEDTTMTNTISTISTDSSPVLSGGSFAEVDGVGLETVGAHAFTWGMSYAYGQGFHDARNGTWLGD